MKPTLPILAVVAVHTAAALSASAATLTVPATWNIYLSGMPDGTISLFGDQAPANSPFPVSGLSLISGTPLRFSATGLTSNSPIASFSGPEGAADTILSHDLGPENGISDVVAPLRSLIGVFLTDSAPNLTSAPARLDFSTPASRDYLSLSPALQQVFFVGDGRTSSLVQQDVIVPAGATRLFVGTMDASQWLNNPGSLTVTIVPEPAAASLLACGVSLLAKSRRRRRT